MEPVDVLIIGAGPAGISTALHLLTLDSSWADRMLILEKANHPRHKLCGGGVTRHGLRILKKQGLPIPLPLPQVRVHDARLIYGRRVVHVRNNPEFVVFHRADLDAYLADQARRRGAVILEGTPVHALAFDADGVAADTPAGRIRAKIVVGADGSKGLGRKMVDGRARPGRVARLLEVVTPALESAPQFQEHYAVFDFTPVNSHLQGYIWDFPSRLGGAPHFNRGVYDSRVYRHGPRAGLPHLLENALRGWDDDPDKAIFEGHPIHRFSPRNRFARPRLLLVGDAAGVDPLFGEGIAPSLGYGRVAARSIQRAFERNDFSFRSYRHQVLGSPVGHYLMLRWAVAWWGYRLSGRPWFIHVLWSLGAALAALAPKGEPL